MQAAGEAKGLFIGNSSLPAPVLANFLARSGRRDSKPTLGAAGKYDEAGILVENPPQQGKKQSRAVWVGQMHQLDRAAEPPRPCSSSSIYAHEAQTAGW